MPIAQRADRACRLRCPTRLSRRLATQAILPSLAAIYGVKPSEIGVAANATTLGVAIAGLLVGGFSARLERKRAVCLSLLLLAIPTSLLAFAPNLTVFALLRGGVDGCAQGRGESDGFVY